MVEWFYSNDEIHFGIAKRTSCKVCGEITKNKKYCSTKCCGFDFRRVSRPPISQLEKEIRSMTWMDIGRKYGVTDNTIRKWARAYKLI